jgi:stage IV sporulation protein FB
MQLNFFGASAYMSNPEVTPRQEGLMAISGPLFSIFFCLTLYPVSHMLSVFNLIVGIFNLIPAYPLDGGRALKAILSYFMHPLTATYVALAPTMILTSALFVFSIYKMSRGDMLGGLKFGALGAYIFSLIPPRQALVDYYSGIKTK